MRLILLVILTALFLCFLFRPVKAQKVGSFANFNPRFEVFELPGGAWGNSVQDMVQDSLGFLWFASQAGLHRYDGQQFVTYRHDPGNNNSPGSDYLEALFLDSKGILWLGHIDAGLTRFDPATNTFTRYRHRPKDPESLSNDWVSSIAEDRQGRIWVATVDGLNCLEDAAAGKWKRYLDDPGKPESQLYSKTRRLYLDKSGTLWMATGFFQGGTAGLCRYNPQTDAFTCFPSRMECPHMLENPLVDALLEDSNGQFWIGTDGGGLYRVDSAGGRGNFNCLSPESNDPAQLCAPFLEQEPPSQRTHIVGSIFEDQAKRIWIGSWGGGLNVYDPHEKLVRHFEALAGQPGSLPINMRVKWIFQSADGALWIGSSGDELVLKVHTQSNAFPFYSIPDWQNEASFSCLREDKDGFIWVGMHGGSASLLRYNRKTYKTTPFPFSLTPGKFQAKNVFALLLDSSGDMWIGTENGLFCVDPKTLYFKHFTYRETDPESLSNNIVYALAQDWKGRIWAGTMGGGLNVLDPKQGKFRRYLHHPASGHSIGGNFVTSVHVDRQGTIWAGGGYGYPDPANPLFMDRFNPDGAFTHFAPAGALGDVSSLVEDHQGNFWFACGWLNGNVQRFDPRTGVFTRYPFANNAIASNYANSLFATEHGKIWMLTDNALVALDPVSGLFQSYGTDLGIRVIGHGVKGGIVPYNDNELLFIGQGGFYSFFPDHITDVEKKQPGTVHITGLKVGNRAVFPEKNGILAKPVWATGAIRLAHDQNDFSFHLSRFNYHNPSGSRTEFMLENYDDGWRSDLFHGEAAYLKVPPGRYTFRTSSIDKGGLRTEGATISIVIAPPWWKTWWAFSLYLLFISGSLYTFYGFQIRRRLEHAQTLRLEELDAVKTRLYTNITHEFRTPLTVIIGMARQALDNPKEYFRQGLEMIIRNGQNLLVLVNQMLELSKLESGKLSLNARQGDVVNFFKYLVESIHSLAESKNIRVHFLSDMEMLTMDFDAERLQQVVSNLLSNAIKFTPAGGQVYVMVGMQPSTGAGQSPSLVLRVKDTGIGLSETELPQIFDRFYQADDAHAGTGIGLALTKELVHLMDGDISVKSTPGHGTEFTVQLPVHQLSADADNGSLWKPIQATATPAPMPIITPSPAEKPLVLIAEDNADVVTYLASCLAADYRLAVAGDGWEGETIALDLIPDLIITDVMMPRKDGFQLCKTLKSDPRTSHIPVILLTARADAASKLVGLEQGADAYLMKPFQREELLVRIRKLLDLRRQLQQHYRAVAGLKPEDSRPVPLPNPTSLEDVFLTRARAIVEAHLDDFSFTVEAFCKEAHLSHSQLHRKISALTGLSANKFIRTIRLNKAKTLLLNPALTITAVAFDSGFSDVSYFGKIFKQEFGLTPVEWRDMQREKHDHT